MSLGRSQRLEARAAEAKEAYANDLAAYRLTAEYAEHANYLREFKLKNGIPPDEPLSASSPGSAVAESNKTKSRRRSSGAYDEPTSPPGDRFKRERIDDDEIENDLDDQLEREDDEEPGTAGAAKDDPWEEQARAAMVLSRGRTPANGRMPPPID